MKRLDDDWALFMVHFFVTDVIGHLSWNNVDNLIVCYRVMDEKIGAMTRRIRNAVILIVSDHGMRNGLHTRQGFYSLNRPLSLSKPKTTEFYDGIRQIVLAPGASSASSEKDGRRRVLLHLMALGYV